MEKKKTILQEIHGCSAEELIRRAIENEGLNQLKLAQKMGCSRQNVSDFLNRAKRGIRFDSFTRMINALGYEVILRKQERDADSE